MRRNDIKRTAYVRNPEELSRRDGCDFGAVSAYSETREMMLFRLNRHLWISFSVNIFRIWSLRFHKTLGAGRLR